MTESFYDLLSELREAVAPPSRLGIKKRALLAAFPFNVAEIETAFQEALSNNQQIQIKKWESN